MRLKKLELYGFKSFAQKTKLEFGQGVTAVVGPNGSGKSNISDAIRWALGEQNPRQLRGNKMEDIIFNGTNQRKPLGMSEVVLHFDNQEGILPVDYNEVTVTRRIYRSGESEYLLNNSPCRLKDIYELFAGTGVGRETYATIEQGKIELLTSSRPEERRLVFEEAAGILKYKNRKREALNKLGEVSQKLVRLDDLLREISTQLIPLGEAKDKAILFQNFYQELQEKEKKLALHKWANLKQEEQSFLDKKKQYQSKLENLEANHRETNEEFDQVRKNLEENQIELDKVQELIHKSLSKLDLLEMEIKIALEKEQDYLEKIKVLEQRNSVLANTYIETEKEIESQKQGKEKHEFAIQSLENEEREIGSSIDEKQNCLIKLEQHLENLKGELIEILNAKAKKQYEVRNLENSQELMDKKKRHLIEEEKRIKDRYQELRNNKEKLNESIHAKQKSFSTIQEQLEQLVNDIITSKSEIQSIEQEIAQDGKRQESLRSRLNLLLEMERSLEGYNKGVKTLLQDKSLAPRICGTVAKLIKVEEKYEKAIEVALGQALQNIVTPTEKDAQQLIEYLKKTSGGRATFLPLNVINGSKFHLEHSEYCLGLGVDLIDFQPEYTKLMNYLLGRIAIAANLDSALILAKKTQNKIKIVTLDGDVINPGGAMTGGSWGGKQLGLLGRMREIKELEQSVLALTQKLLAKEEKLSAKKKELECLELNHVKNKKEIDSLTLILRDLVQEGHSLAKEEDGLKQEEELLVWEKEQLVSEETKISAQAKAEQEVFHQLEKNKDSLEKEIIDGQKTLNQEKEQLEKVKETLTQLKINLAAKKQDGISKEREIKRLEAGLKEIDREKESNQEESIRVEGALLNLKKEIKQKKEERVGWLNKKEKESLSLSKLREENLLLKEQELNLEKKKKALDKALNNLEKEWFQEASALARIETELRHHLETIKNSYDFCPLEILPDYILDKKEKTALEETAKERQEKIRELGTVNLGAIEEYQNLKERHDFLLEQYKDLQGAKQSLEKLLQEIDEIMEKKFLETFGQVQDEFKQVFKRLFNGGKAELSLSEPDKVLTTGIDITVQPPGKKLQNLSLLSGGEKALTAVALLFAILRTNPSPFCLLDEIDAPFDDANVQRVAELLKEMSGRIQFIIITHRKGAMEVADALYGVTMEEAGVSRLVSVRLEEQAS